jgi:type IV pilus assembly protein PilC
MILQHTEQRSLWYKKIFYYLKAGQSLSEAVKTAAVDTDTMYIYEELASGLRFSEVCSLDGMEKVFTKTEISLLKVAEQTGTMQSVCKVISEMLQDQHRQKQKLIAAMIYPILVLLMALGLLLMILFVVVPKIGPLFSSMKHVPMATKILIAASNHVVNIWYIDVGIFFSGVILFFYIKNRTKYFYTIQKSFEYIFLYIPYLKDIYILWFIERWAQTVYLSLASNVSLVQSLRFADESISNTYIQLQFKKVTQSVGLGMTCFEALHKLDIILKVRLQDWMSVIASGEKTGILQEVFKVSQEHIADNLQVSFDTFQKIVEPMLIVLVGIMVLGICLAIILPMYQLTQSIQ